MRCLLLGGGGFIGSHLAERLVELRHPVHVFDRPGAERLLAPAILRRVRWTAGDFTRAADVEAVLDDAEVVFHLVSTTLPKTSNDSPLHDAETNLLSTLRLLDLIKARPGRRIVFVSSGGTVYGRPQRIPIDEQHPTEPLCAYGITKLAIEKYLGLYRELHGLESVVLRLANPYGGNQRPGSGQGAVAVFLHKALRGETLDIWGDGEVVRDYIHISDVVSALVSAMTYAGPHRVFNIGSGTGTSLNTLLADIELLLGHPISRRYLEPRGFDVPRNILDTTLARRELGWIPRTPFREGLAAVLKRIRAQEPPSAAAEQAPAAASSGVRRR